MLWLWPPADCNRQVSDGLAASYSFHIGVGGYGYGYSIGYCSQALITTENKGPVSLQIISCGDKVISPIDKCC